MRGLKLVARHCCDNRLPAQCQCPNEALGPLFYHGISLSKRHKDKVVEKLPSRFSYFRTPATMPFDQMNW